MKNTGYHREQEAIDVYYKGGAHEQKQKSHPGISGIGQNLGN
jgi:hypothetical protein